MTTRGKLLLAAFALLVLPTVAAAADDEDYARPGWFFGAQGTYAVENIDGGSFDNTGGFNVRAGKRYGPKFALELEYEWLDDFGTGGTELNAWMLSANGRYYLLKGRVQPFLLLGMGLVLGETEAPGVNSDDDEAFGVRFGQGVEIYMSPNLALIGDISYVVPAGDLSDMQFATFSGGFLYRR